MMKKITVIGAGAFGFALAKHLSDKIISPDEYHWTDTMGEIKSLDIFDINVELIEHLKLERSQKYFFPESRVNDLVKPTTDMKAAVKDADILILSLPAQHIRGFIKKAKDSLKNGVIILNAAKGIEVDTNKFISEIIKEELDTTDYTLAVLSGGMIAKEFISGFGVFGADISCEDKDVGLLLQQVFSSKKLRVYLNDDILGVESAGALKNVASIAAGFMDGLGFPYGSKTLILSLVAYEIRCISIKMGAKSHTFRIHTQSFGNDFLMSTTGNTRNREFGQRVAQGTSAVEVIEQMKKENKTAEGYYSAKVAHSIVEKHSLKSPIINMVYDVLYANKDIRKCVEELMSSDLEPTLNCSFHGIC